MADQEIERLVTVWDANFTKLDEKLTKIQRSHFKAAAAIKKDADSFTRQLEQRYGAAGQAFGNIINDSRLATLQAGSSHLRVFGSALEPLGALGLAAAAGVAALGLATQQTIAAMQFADEIDDAAQKLAIGTEALQEYRFAMTEVGGEAKDADEALKGFSVALGSAQSGLSPRAMKPFAALGFTQDQIKSFGSVEEALIAVAGKVSALGSAAEQAAVVDKLGLTPMLPLLREGVDAMERLRRKAQELGYVMDAELVSKGAQANQEFETMARVIDVQLKSAFVGLSDEVLAFTGALAGALGKLNDFIDRFERWKARIDGIYGEGFVSNVIQGNSAQALDQALTAVRSGAAARSARFQREVARGNMSQAAGTGSLDPSAIAAFGRPAETPGGTSLIPPTSRNGRAKRDNSAEQRAQRIDRFNDQLARLETEIVRSYDRGFLSIDGRADQELAVARDELAGRIRDITQAEEEYLRTNGLRGLSAAEGAQLREKLAELDVQKRAAIEWERRADSAEYRARLEEDAAQSAVALMGIDAQIATTTRERARIEREILLATIEIARKRKATEIANDPNLTPEQAQTQMAQFEQVASAQLKLFDTSELNNMRDTFRSYGREVVQAIRDGNLGEYIAEKLQSKLIDMALNGMFNTIFGGGKGGSDWFSAFASMFAGGRAGGGSFAPGQWGVVGEEGAEAIRALPSGGVQVLSNGATRALSRGMGGGRSVVQHITFDNRGAVLWQDALAQQRAYADQAAARAQVGAVRQSSMIGRKALPAAQAQFRRLGA